MNIESIGQEPHGTGEWRHGGVMANMVQRLLRLVPVRFLSFALVGGMGMVIHFLVMAALFAQWKLDFVWSHSAAAMIAMVGTFVLNNVLTYRDMRLRGWQWITGWLTFSLACAIGALVNVGVATQLVWFGIHWVSAALAGIAAGAIWNYWMTAIVTWNRKCLEREPPGSENGSEI
jgi:dolichol-phosphate mannosyltransferase